MTRRSQRTWTGSATLLIVCGALAAMARPAASQPAPSYTVTDLGTLGGNSFAYELNLRGQVTGTYDSAVDNQRHAFLYFRGVMTDLGTLGGSWAYGNGINERGDVVGNSATGDGLQHAYLWRDGSMTDLGTLGGQRSQANAVNTRGQIVGWAYRSDGSYHAFLSEGGVMTDLGTLGGWSNASDVNELGQVVGSYLGATGSRPFAWTGGAMTDPGTLAGGTGGANESNLFGTIAGWSSPASGVSRPVIYRGGAITDLGSLGGAEASAYSINDLDQAVGYAYTAGQRRHAVVYRGGVLHDLNDLIPAGAGVELMVASGINDFGRIVGYGCFGGQVDADRCVGGQIRAVLLTPARWMVLQDLAALVDRLGLPARLTPSLWAKLRNALASLSEERFEAACGQLGAFVNEVEAQRGKRLTHEQADRLLRAAHLLRAAIGCR
jgi:probable HAF family extracellular repeat protein